MHIILINWQHRNAFLHFKQIPSTAAVAVATTVASRIDMNDAVASNSYCFWLYYFNLFSLYVFFCSAVHVMLVAYVYRGCLAD